MSGFIPDELKYDWEQEESAKLNQQTATNDLAIHKLQDGTLAVEQAYNKKSGLDAPNPERSIKDGADGMNIAYKKKQIKEVQAENRNAQSLLHAEEKKLNDSEESLPSMVDLFVQAIESGRYDDFSETELHKINEYIDKHPDKLSDEQILILAGTNIDKMKDEKKKEKDNDKTAGASVSIQSGGSKNSHHAKPSEIKTTPLAETDIAHREIDITPKPMPVKSLSTPKPPGF